MYHFVDSILFYRNIFWKYSSRVHTKNTTKTLNSNSLDYHLAFYPLQIIIYDIWHDCT